MNSPYEATIGQWFQVIDILTVMHGGDDEVVVEELVKIIAARVDFGDCAALLGISLMALHSDRT